MSDTYYHYCNNCPYLQQLQPLICNHPEGMCAEYRQTHIFFKHVLKEGQP
jgi:hypothetical protein